ncbi:MAG: hypothetical protein AB8G95_19790 [Anaerolineae bacterium]
MQTIDSILYQIRSDLNLSLETEQEVLEEIRTHFEDALEEGRQEGLDDQVILQQAAEQFGITITSEALRHVHLQWESADAVIACIVPTAAALILRWLSFAPNGSAIGWQNLLLRPAFWIVALVCLFIPILQFKHWRYAMISWGIFWFFTVIFVTLPNIQSW